MAFQNLRRIPLYFHTIRQLRLSQVLARLRLCMRRQTIYRWPGFLAWRYRATPAQAMPARQPLLPADRDFWVQVVRSTEDPEKVRSRLADLQANRFTFLSRTISFGDHLLWEPPGETRLWRYNLHYFDFLWDLILADAWSDDKEPYHCFRRLVDHWITQNPMANGVGWHAYPLALRVVNWIYAALGLETSLARDDAFRTRFLVSLYSQCRFLADHLEWDCQGNHLLEDGKTLLTAGLFFRGAEAEQWFQQGAQLVWQALTDQILADGGHYERSPMYHAIVLQDYLEVLALYQGRGLQPPIGLGEKLRSMVDFFIGLRHPDGDLPLLGDTALGIARGPEDLLPVAATLLSEPRYKWPGQTFGAWSAFLLGEEGGRKFARLPPSESPAFTGARAFPQSGYYILGDASCNAMILDGGEIGPDEVPAHGHCNMFGYELSVKNQRVVVDSGVETYEPGWWRDYYRSTRAHNTLLVDDREQSEVWAAFRVARRAKLQAAQWEIRSEVVWFTAAHNGFSRKSAGLLHRRLVVYVPQAFWLIADYLGGAPGAHRLESLIHLHPEVTTVEEGSFSGILPVYGPDGSQLVQLLPFGFGEIRQCRGSTDPIQGWYAPRFGERWPNKVVQLGYFGNLPHLCGYVIMMPAEGQPRVEVSQTAAEDVYTVIRSPRAYRITYTPGGITFSEIEAI